MSAPSEAQLDPAPRRREGPVVGLISGGHFMSHFFVLCLPPLFLILKVEFNVSYVELGLAMTAYGLLGGFMQAPVGFLVDRLGPRNLLFAGLGLNAGAILMMGFAQNFEMLLVFAVLAGLGNSVFHPADYAILNGSIHPNRLGRAFSMHTFSGFFGSACAPVGILALVSYTDWRVALISVGLFGLLIWAVMLLCRSSLQGAAAPDTADGDVSTAPGRTGIRLLLSPPVLLFLGFFIAYGMVTGGLRAFSVTALVNLHGLGLDQANAALTGFLFGVVGGILLAGVIVDRYPQHARIAVGALLLALVCTIAPIWAGLPGLALIVLLTVVGVGLGAALPPRDLLIRALIPPGETGKVFGFVFVGFTVGGSIAPPFFGGLLDAGNPSLIFGLSAAFIVLSIAFVIAAQLTALRQRAKPV